MAEHLLDRAQVGAALEEVGRERVAQQVRMDALGIEAGPLGELAQDQEGACASERAALSVQEELGPVAPVEVRPAARQIAAQGLRPPPARAVRRAPCLPFRVGGPAGCRDRRGPGRGRQPRSRAARRRRAARRAPGHGKLRGGDPVRSLDQPLDLARRQGAREPAPPPRQRDVGCGVVRANAEQDEVTVEGSRCRRTPRDRARRQPPRAQVGYPGLDVPSRRCLPGLRRENASGRPGLAGRRRPFAATCAQRAGPGSSR